MSYDIQIGQLFDIYAAMPAFNSSWNAMNGELCEFAQTNRGPLSAAYRLFDAAICDDRAEFKDEVLGNKCITELCRSDVIRAILYDKIDEILSYWKRNESAPLGDLFKLLRFERDMLEWSWSEGCDDKYGSKELVLEDESFKLVLTARS